MNEDRFIGIRTAETTTALFQDLVHDAQSEINLTLPHELEAYLVFMMLRFLHPAPELHETLALKFLTANLKTVTGREHELRDTGDTCLILAGLFPEQADRRNVSLSYFIRLGRTAYDRLAQDLQRSQAALYRQLCEGFGSLLDVLHVIHGFDKNNKKLQPMHAYALWQETGSPHARAMLGRGQPVRSRQRHLI